MEWFYLKFEQDWFKKGDILQGVSCSEVVVTKVYKQTWWRKVLLWLGFKVRMCQVKVKKVEQ